MLNNEGVTKIVVGEESEVPSCSIIVRLLVDYSSSQASFSEDTRTLLDNQADQNVGLIVLRQGDESEKIKFELQNSLHNSYPKAKVNSLPCAFKLLVKAEKLMEGEVSKKNLIALCDILKATILKPERRRMSSLKRN